MTEVDDPVLVLQLGAEADGLVTDSNADWIMNAKERAEQVAIHDRLAKEHTGNSMAERLVAGLAELRADMQNTADTGGGEGKVEDGEST